MRPTVNTAVIAATACAIALSGCAQVKRFRTRADAVAQPACTDFTFPIYFASGSDVVPREALRMIEHNAAMVKACNVAEVSVTGLADAEGSAQVNLELSKRRAMSVANALAARGYPAPKFEVAAAGETGAATAAGVAPLRRRTEVAVKFASRTPGAE